MNGNEFSRLSYKELQALALRYRVPGNIKKKLLVKVLQAAKGGNEHEVDRLLQDLKQNRKKRVRKLKSSKLGLTSTPLHSPNYVMADDYYCPQQQPPYQWVAAEEEIASREEGRIPPYEEFKQFILRKIQKDFRTYDANNNPMQESTIVDLRTVGVSTNLPSIPLDTGDYTRSNIIAVNNPENFVYQSNDRVEYQTLENLNANGESSILLKKMLQAPAGANLGEIASPVFSGYKMWPMEQYQSTNLLDNSDTLTAESDTQENEGNIDNNTECYGLFSGVREEYFLQEPTFVKNVEEIGEQISGVLTNETNNQYKYTNTNMEAHQNYENWNITNAVDTVEAHCGTSDVHTSKMFQTMYYENVRPDNLSKQGHDENPSSYQYHLMENVQSPYRSSQNLLNLNSCEEVQYCDGNVITSMQSDSSNTYYLQNLTKYNSEPTGEYYNNVHTIPNTNTDHDQYAPTSSQVLSHSNHCNTTVFYEYSYTNQMNNAPMSETFESHQQNNNVIINHEDNTSKDLTRGSIQPPNGVLSPFWPRCYFNNSEPGLENIVNLHTSKRLDLTRLEQTSCVYCYMAPIVTHAVVPPGSVCSQKERFIAEYRQHSFTPYWLLYNDTANEIPKTHSQENEMREIVQEEVQTLQTSPCNSDVQSPSKDSENSIAEVWANNNMNYETEIEQNVNVCEEMNVESAECIFPVIATDSLGMTVDPLSLSTP